MMRYIEEARDRHGALTHEPRAHTVADWLRDHEHKMRRKAIRTGRPWAELKPRPSGLELQARVDRNHWITDCPCGNAPCVWWAEDGTGLALCYTCGAIHDVAPIADRDEIEAELLKRPPRARQFDPGETPEDIRRQNAVLLRGES